MREPPAAPLRGLCRLALSRASVPALSPASARLDNEQIQMRTRIVRQGKRVGQISLRTAPVAA